MGRRFCSLSTVRNFSAQFDRYVTRTMPLRIALAVLLDLGYPSLVRLGVEYCDNNHGRSTSYCDLG